MNASWLLPFGLCTALLSVQGGSAPSAKGREFFESKIRPVLAEHCYECHNSVDTQKGGIALDYRAAIQESKIIIPGNPEASRLVQAVKHLPNIEPMPSKAPKLASIVIDHFEQWIRMGAPDPRSSKPTREQLKSQVHWETVRDQRKAWWSFQPLQYQSPPPASALEWNANPIDRFLHAQFDRLGLHPQEKASPERLIRRLHLVLIGIPPKPEVVEDFFRDPSPQHYRKIVNQLLASPQFGERWARYWMDWFRYAESHGSEGDPTIPHASQYRDYLIRAINHDTPYDQLIREHLAGDQLAEPRLNPSLGINESAIGPAHFRLAPHGFGVTDAYDEQITFTDNQIDVLTKATLGLTVSCARCHHHKFDPVSQEDFYRLYGIMISSRPAIVNIDSPARQQRHRKALQMLKQTLRRQLSTFWLNQTSDSIERLRSFEFAEEPGRPKQGKPSPLSDHQAEVNRNPKAHPFGIWKALQGLNLSEWSRVVTSHVSHFRTITANNERLKKSATFYADLRDQKTYDSWFKTGNGLAPNVSPAGSFSVAGTGPNALIGIYPSGVYTHLISDKHTGVLGSIFHRAKGRWTGVRAVGRSATARFSVRSYPLTHGGLHPAPVLPDRLAWVQIKKYFYWNDEMGYYRLETALDKTAGVRGGGKERSWFGIVEVYGGDEAMEESGVPLLALIPHPESIRDRATLEDAYLSALENALQAWQTDSITDRQAEFLDAFIRFGFLPNQLTELPSPILATIKHYRELENAIPIPQRAPGVIEAEPWNQPLLTRGNYRHEKEPIQRGFLEAFGGEPYPPGSSGRLQFAEDLLAESNPLTSRVIVNRLWHHTFGRGLVASVDNFGRMGDQPSHPQLLDYLALQFRNQGWSIKQLLRELVSSRAFQSKSTTSAEQRERDPNNQYLSYFSPRRLDAEALLDTLQWVAQHLDITRPGLGQNGQSNQRAVYRRVRRNFLDPFLKAFDLPIPTTTTGRRNLTQVPSQSLMLMNGDLGLKAARHWSRLIRNDQSLTSDHERIERVFLQAYSRKPSPEEEASCLEYLGAAPADPATNPSQSEAYFRMVHAILNSKELIYVH